MAAAKKLTTYLHKRMIELAGLGFNSEEIACLLRVPESFLTTVEATETRKRARLAMKEKLIRKQITQALAGDKTMLVWCGKVQLGQKEEMIVGEKAKVVVSWE